jgi:hypothetical protein
MKARQYRRARDRLNERQMAWDRLPQQTKAVTKRPGSLNPKKR